jgi:hypothetical protein
LEPDWDPCWIVLQGCTRRACFRATRASPRPSCGTCSRTPPPCRCEWRVRETGGYSTQLSQRRRSLCLSHCASPTVSLPLGLTVSPTVFLPLCLPLCLSRCVSLTVSLPLCLSHWASLCLPLCLSHCVSPAVSLPLCLSRCVSPTVSLPLCLSHTGPPPAGGDGGGGAQPLRVRARGACGRAAEQPQPAHAVPRGDEP